MSGQLSDTSTTISFVKVVEQYPCLWNYSMKEYSRIDLTSLAWKKIASEEVNDTEQNCRDRWKNIRTAFGRSIRPLKSGTKWRKPYYMSTHLDFLRPYVKVRSPRVPAEDDIDIDYVNLATDGPEQDGTSRDTTTTDVILNNEAHHDMKRKKNSPISDSEESYSEWLELKKRKRPQVEQEDGDLLFFRALLPDFKKLNEKRKRDLKVKFVTILNEELDQAETQQQYNSNQEYVLLNALEGKQETFESTSVLEQSIEIKQEDMEDEGEVSGNECDFSLL